MNKFLHTSLGLVSFFAALLIAGCVSVPSTGLHIQSSKGTIVATSIASQGCGKPAPLLPGTSAVKSIDSGGLTRSYLLYLPPGYHSTAKDALVLNFHGHGSNAIQQAYRTAFTSLANRQGFIIAYPQGVIGPDGSTGWATGLASRPEVNDVLFVSDLLSRLQATLCIDPLRIYATGFSNGGGMTNLLACTLDERIAAFAPVSGSFPPAPGRCHPQRPVPMMEFHGTADHVVPYTGNHKRSLPPISLWLQQWAARNGCTRGPINFYKSQDVIGEKWTACKGNATVIGYRILGEGHTWPTVLFNIRTGNDVSTSSASALIWSFFQSHPLTGRK